MKKIAVISADVINSSKFVEDEFLHTLDVLEEPTQNYLAGPGIPILTSRGDSLQLMITEVRDSLLKAIYLKSYFKRTELGLRDKQGKGTLDIRISLAVGQATHIPDDIGRTLEEPFVLSGRALDQMKGKKQTFIITTGNSEYNKEFQLTCLFLENIFDGWTMAQAEVIYYLVQGFKQTEIAEKLNLTQPSVSNRIQLAHWNLIEKANNRFVDIIEKI